MNAKVTDGPERWAMAAAVRTKRPAPMMAPIPNATSDQGPNVRFRCDSPLCALRLSIDFVRNNVPANLFLRFSSGFGGPGPPRPDQVDRNPQQHDDQARPCVLWFVAQ